MSHTKKVWVKPVLIVIGRGKPEESVLEACKNAQKTGAGASTPGCLSISSCKGIGSV